jgi:hypothetical protein
MTDQKHNSIFAESSNYDIRTASQTIIEGMVEKQKEKSEMPQSSALTQTFLLSYTPIPLYVTTGVDNIFLSGAAINAVLVATPRLFGFAVINKIRLITSIAVRHYAAPGAPSFGADINFPVYLSLQKRLTNKISLITDVQNVDYKDLMQIKVSEVVYTDSTGDWSDIAYENNFDLSSFVDQALIDNEKTSLTLTEHEEFLQSNQTTIGLKYDLTALTSPEIVYVTSRLNTDMRLTSYLVYSGASA